MENPFGVGPSFSSSHAYAHSMPVPDFSASGAQEAEFTQKQSKCTVERLDGLSYRRCVETVKVFRQQMGR